LLETGKIDVVPAARVYACGIQQDFLRATFGQLYINEIFTKETF